MNKFKQAIMDEVVKPAINSIPRSIEGVVMDYRKSTNTAIVAITPPVGGSSAATLLYNVPVAFSNGINHCGPFQGQRVLISFNSGHYNNPIITGIIDHIHQMDTREHKQTHRRRGAYLPDILCTR
jgi:hypothetical protein